VTTNRRAFVLALGDAAALVLFSVVGLVNHKAGVTLEAVTRTAGPLLVCWFVVALVAKTYTQPNAWTMLRTWFPAVTLAVLVRYVWLRRPGDLGELTVFWLVALAFTLLFLVAWRLLASRVLLRPRSPVAR
jgi:hypothetical protein